MREIYLDNAATTRCDPQAAQVAVELMTEDYGNPSSLHAKGIAAQKRLDTARQQVSEALGCGLEEVIFTGSGTEANNLAILGAAGALRRRGGHIVVSAAMHASARKPLNYLEQQGFRVTWVPPLTTGHPDVEAMAEAVDGDTVLLVCEMVNGEVGTVTPVARLCTMARRKNPGIFIHCDGVQGFGKVVFSAKRLGVDSLSISGHKIYGPKGCGVLYLRRGARLVPVLLGGGQETGRRPGTENLPAICALGVAAGKAASQLQDRLVQVSEVREYFVNKAGTMPGICMNSPADATPYISNISVLGYRSETLLHYLAERGIYVSSGSACSRGAASHVLGAMGLDSARIDSALRVSLSAHNTKEDIDAFFQSLAGAMETLARRN